MDFIITLAGKQAALTICAFKWYSPDPPLSADHLFFSAYPPVLQVYLCWSLLCSSPSKPGHWGLHSLRNLLCRGKFQIVQTDPKCTFWATSSTSKIRLWRFYRWLFPIALLVRKKELDDDDAQVCIASISNPHFLFFSIKLTVLRNNRQVPVFPEFGRQREKLPACKGNSGMEIICAHSSNLCRSPNGSLASKSRPKRATAQMFSGKLLRQRDRKGTSRKQKVLSKMENKHIAMKVPIYELKRTVSYNYGLPLSSCPSPENKWVWVFFLFPQFHIASLGENKDWTVLKPSLEIFTEIIACMIFWLLH